MTLLPDIERYVAAQLRRFGSGRGARSHRQGRPSRRAAPRLRIELDHLKTDYRDVILAAEYVPKAGSWVRIRDLDEPISD
jgi:hypothetical protein